MSSGPRAALAAGLLYAAMAVAWTAPSSLAPATMAPDLGDPLHLAYVMAWDAHQLVRHPLALFESNSFYPYPHSLTFGDHLLPEAISVAPVFWATGNAVLASNVAMVLALSLSALAMFLLVRHATGSPAAAFLAGSMYAFNSFTRHELLRVHVLNLQWWPLALLFLDRFVRGGKARDGALLAITMTLQALSGSYYLIYSLLVGPAWVLGAFGLARRWPSRHETRSLAAALAVCGAASAAMLWPYRIQLQTSSFEKAWAAGADLLAYVDPEPASWLGRHVELLARHSEVPHFLGFAGLALVLLGTVRLARRPAADRALGILALATTVVGIALSLGPVVFVGGARLSTGPYKLLYDHVRLVRGMASPERIGVLAILGAAILAGLGAAWLIERLGPGEARTTLIVVLALALPLEHWTPAVGASVPTGARVPTAYRWLAQESREPLVDLPIFSERAKRLRASYLYLSTYHWRPIPIGRTSFYPPAHDLLAWSLRAFPDEMSIVLLQRLGVLTLVVHPFAWPEAERAERLAALEAEPRLTLVRAFDDAPDPASPLGLGRERVYRLAAPQAAIARPCTPEDELPRASWTLRHSGRKQPDLARDGDRRTAWFTQIPQKPGDFFEVMFEHPETVSAAAIELAYPQEEFPRNLAVFGTDDGALWRRLSYADGPEERWATIADLVERPQQARLVARLEPVTLHGLSLRIGLREQEQAWPQWSIPELRLYRSCR